MSSTRPQSPAPHPGPSGPPASSLVRSALLPVPHGFSTRLGGVSQGAFESLNLGLAVGDERAHVEENYRRLAALAGAPLAALHRVSQVHGDRVIRVHAPSGAPTATPPPTEGEADGLWTDTPGQWVGVSTADCVPILLVDPEGRRVAAVHSGWRGTEANIVGRAVEALAAQGSAPSRLLAAVGPCIQACCYEVSPELGERFRARFGPGVVDVDGAGRRVRLDLSRAVRQSLRDAGLGEGQVDVLPDCTACDAHRFFSHRRDAGRSGRHLSFAVHAFG
ncbi:peptidoglycan editing factor PgeF [Aggregicoccus sp. 17bor-14]|uniref:peptidoglycan editing factor PgeF n=1 Tax=Myxococcaceae TaxID=31 RepID=UPI00129CEC93|nr:MULTISPECIES: peptidoglycan editing factor PgeF [Myxococcaceae]MBF5041240.1 peptidoglycan editing factor PgeF [Simulacricoccus sp. 17bor-14]MRI87026.1 peptidoglycan editing factor PgeF [Aggregicoccus sp. 17bor-14]